MSTNPLLATKKRDLSVLYGKTIFYTNSSLTRVQSAYVLSNDQVGYPPSKRHRSANTTEAKAMDDVFGDHEDFTADDLEEIEILASQAYTQDTHLEVNPSNNNQGNVRQGNVRSNSRSTPQFLQPHRQERDPNVHSNHTRRLDGLQSPLEDLKQKLKALQDEVLVKNGEIKVLRDALHQTESSLEQQKIAHLQLEKEKAQLQSEKEKELLKKVQSLQSELQFKDAEMNELKSKLQSNERKASAPLPTPKKSPTRATKQELCPSPLPGKRSFPTKESFRANTNVKSFMVAPPQSICLPEPEAPRVMVKQAKLYSRSCHMQRINSQGSVLLNSLMQQSFHGVSLGLCHLLSSNLDTLAGSPTRRGHSSNSSENSGSGMSSSQHMSLKDAQKVAITGLNSIALDAEFVGEQTGAQIKRGLPHLNNMSRLPGAALILPLVEFHIVTFCQALQLLDKSGVSPSNIQSLSSSSSQGTVISSVEDTISSLGEPALSSLGILYYLVFYSLEVVETLLQSNPETRTQMPVDQNPSTSKCAEIDAVELNMHPLFKSLFYLLSSTGITYKGDIFKDQALRVLVKLAENSPIELLCRFQVLLNSSVLLQCLSSDSSLPIALNAVRLLTLFADCQILTALFCSCSEKRAESLWLQFEHQVVRLLNKLITQGWSSPLSDLGVPCQCTREVVKALVLTLHQGWLFIRRSSIISPTPIQNRSVQILRETVMLLYNFFQKDKNFSEHCLEVLHQYDQAVPGVRAILRKCNLLKESEEFALDELCPPEVEAEDENMDCS
ncbi:ATR-interacting protein [Gastrophryne carolinensis]